MTSYILKAHNHLRENHWPHAAGIVVLMTDGQQTVGGNDNDAIRYSSRTTGTLSSPSASAAIMSVMQAMATARRRCTRSTRSG